MFSERPPIPQKLPAEVEDDQHATAAITPEAHSDQIPDPPPMPTRETPATPEGEQSTPQPLPEAPVETITSRPTAPEAPFPDADARTPHVDLESLNKPYERKGLFSPAVQERLKSAPETVKNAVAKAYEGVTSLPVVVRALGKMEMAYSQRWIERHELKALRSKEKFDRHDAEYKTLERSQQEIETQMRELAAAGIPGADSLQTFLQKIDKQKTAALEKREAAEIKIRARQEKIDGYTQRRDQIADRFIGELDEKIQPHQERMKDLDAAKADCQLEIDSAKARHDHELSELKALSDKKAVIVAALLRSGMSQRKIDANPAVVNIDTHIANGRARVRSEKDKLNAKLAKVRYQTAQVKKKSSPYEQKRAALMRLKNGRRVEIHLPTTETVAVQNAPTEPDEGTPDASEASQGIAATRTSEAMPPSGTLRADNDNPPLPLSGETPRETAEAGRIESTLQLETPLEYVGAWNSHLQKMYGEKYKELQIDTREFLKSTRLKPKTKLTSKRFYQLIKSYYGSKGVDRNLRSMALRHFNSMDRSRTMK